MVGEREGGSSRPASLVAHQPRVKKMTCRSAAVASVGACGFYLLLRSRSAANFLQRHRQALRQLFMLPQPTPPDEDPDLCAICLEAPSFPVKTQCGHRFCLRCFQSWASRQVPPTSTARCPLCTASVVRLTPELWPTASVDALARARWLIGSCAGLGPTTINA